MPETQVSYARIYGPDSTNWSPNAAYNEVYLRSQEGWLNDLLRARGHVFLNEAYDAFGIKRSSSGALVGWTQGPIDITTLRTDPDGSMLLDFNVEGVIWDKLED